MSHESFLNSYIETALWSEIDSEGIPLDDSKYADVELVDETRAQMAKDCAEFEKKLDTLLGSLDASIINSLPNRDRMAHDFWLTRNRHGAGFWDGDYPEPLGNQLTELAHSFGECILYVSDDGKIYLN